MQSYTESVVPTPLHSAVAASPAGDVAPSITVIITCMGRLHHLTHSLPLVAGQTGLHCVLVDYGCPDESGAWVEQHHPGVQVVRAQAVGHFNISRARNLGAAQARTPWLCFMDADTLVDTDFAARVISLLQPGIFLQAEPCTYELAGLVVCQRSDFEAVGGYDPLFTGWGTEDRDFYTRLGLYGCHPAIFPAAGIRSIPHDDAERTRHHALADRFLSLRINAMYFQVKTDLARHTAVVELPLNQREALRARIQQLVLSNPLSAVTMQIGLPWSGDFTHPPGWLLRRSLSYSFEPIDENSHDG